MRIIGRILIGLVGLVVVLAVVGFFLPRNVIVERDLTINAPPEDVFPHLNSLQAFTAWSPWAEYDPDMTVSFSGPESGVGNVMEWQSEHRNVGNGRQEIVESIENARVATSLVFGEMPEASAWWDLAAEGDGTRITWGLNSDMGMNPAGRWFGLFLDGMVGADYERGLSQLQGLVEG